MSNRIPGPRAACAAALPLLLLSAPLGAQQLRAAPLAASDSLLLLAARTAPAVPARQRAPVMTRRSFGGLVGGAVVGAFLGYFASQVLKSDWEDEAGTGDENRRAFAISGAALGAVTGYALMRERPQGSVNDRLPRAQTYDPMDRDIIVKAEIIESGATNAFDLVQARRPRWLSTRGTNTFREEGRVVGYDDRSAQLEKGRDETIVVYLDQARLGGVDKLKELPVADIVSVQYLDARAASFRFGSGHDHGAIVVLTR